MSSSYHLLCMSHDPVIVIDIGATSPGQALTAVADRSAFQSLAEHPHCPLMIGRYSYPLIELCCPGSQHSTHPNANEWADASLLRVALLAAMRCPSDDAVVQALARLHRCWEPKRLDRLRFELGVEDDPAAARPVHTEETPADA